MKSGRRDYKGGHLEQRLLKDFRFEFKDSCSYLFRALGPVDFIACVPVIPMLKKCGTSCKEDNLCLCIAKELST